MSLHNVEQKLKPKVTVEWIAFLYLILEVQGSTIGPEVVP
jgi:hypothetical protein